MELNREDIHMKDIRIFIASSKELLPERNALAFLVLSKEEEFAARGFRVRLAKWEYVDPRMTIARTEDRYLDELRACDAAFVLFRNVAGIYTREELGRALDIEKAGTARLRDHEVLFAADSLPDSDAARLRASLPDGTYGIWSSLDELLKRFLALVERVAAMDELTEAGMDDLRTVSAFLAADDELAADRDAFADMVLNLNDVLARRGIRVQLRFYDPSRHRELLDASEMALVLYYTSCNSFGPERMRDAYDRTRRDENPKRLYVFFRDADDAELAPSFASFKRGFAENLGHFFCAFENADTLKLNFLLSLENVLGEGASFVRLDGRRVMADELDVGDLASLPMVANNDGLNDMFTEADRIASLFDAQREVCRMDPENNSAYSELLRLSTRKNELEAALGKELARSLDLAKRMAAISAKEANDTIFRARELLDRGRIEEAVRLLDGASSEIDDILGDIGGLDDLLAQKLMVLESWIDVELFRADTVLAFAHAPFTVRFEKAERLFLSLLAKAEKALVKNRPRSLAKVLRRFADLYGEIEDSLRPIPLLEKALKLYQAIELLEPGGCRRDIAATCMALAILERANNRLELSRCHFEAALEVYRLQGTEATSELAKCLNGLANLHSDVNDLAKAESEYSEALSIRRHLASVPPAKFESDVAATLNDLAGLHMTTNRLAEAEREYSESLSIR